MSETKNGLDNSVNVKKEEVEINNDIPLVTQADINFQMEQDVRDRTRYAMLCLGHIPMDRNARDEVRKIWKLVTRVFWFHFSCSLFWLMCSIVLPIAAIAISCILWFQIEVWMTVVLCLELFGILTLCSACSLGALFLYHFLYVSREVPKLPSEKTYIKLKKAIGINIINK